MSKNKKTHFAPIATGLAIYKRGVSPYWYARIWNSQSKRYSTRSTKCTIKADAIEEAFAIRQQIGGSQKSPKVPKEYTFRHFAEQQMLNQQRLVQIGQRNPRLVQDDVALLERENDGILKVLGNKDVRKITTKDLRGYLSLLDQNRANALASSTRSKHLIVIRKVMNLAKEDGAIDHLPNFPVESNRDTPRPSFTKDELQHLYAEIRKIRDAEELHIKGNFINQELYDLVVFLANTGLRPIIGEVFALKHQDISIKQDDEFGSHLYLTIKKGKTGFRTTTSTHIGKERYESLLLRRGSYTQQDFVFYPELENRKYAASVASRQFKLAVKSAGLEKDPLGQNRVLYSLRHYYIQMALSREVPIYELAASMGTSVQMIERFYGKFPTYSPKQAASLNRGMKKGS